MQVTPAEWDRIKILFEEALVREPADRDSYLLKACPEDYLRELVQKLVIYHSRAGDFLDKPLWTPAALLSPAQAFASGDLLADRFQVNRLIAKGGMGEVYEATDVELKDQVAIKTIRPEILLHPRTLEKFKREVLLAKQVTHPNVCRIFDLFRHRASAGEETYFVSMELLSGETLAERLERTKRMTQAEALPIVAQMAMALHAAHQAGIVHRDFKPGNVVLVPTPTPPGIRAVVTDFGLAVSALEDSRKGFGDDSTGFFGTPAYMSPEQIEGHDLTAASDIYSLGLVIYQMVTGARPFQADTPVAAALRRLKDDPTPPHRLVPDLGGHWEPVILKCLERDPTRRFHSAAEVVEALRPETPHSLMRTDADRRISIPLGRLRRLLPLGSAIAAALIFSLALYFHRLQTSPAPYHSDAIVIADFVNTTGNTLFDGTLRQALHDKLEQSPFFNLLPEHNIRVALRYMGRPPSERLTRETAREVCLRGKGKALLLGAISLVDNHYRIALEMTDCWTGQTLGAQQVTVNDQESVLDALDLVTDSLRKQLREPPALLQRFNIPIPEATSASLEAVKNYVLAMTNWNTIGGSAAIPFFKRAVELDPNFAFAWAQLGTVYGNLGEKRLARDALQKAFERSNRVTEREKFYIISHYHAFVTGDLEKETQAYEQWKQAYPADAAWRINLGVDYALAGQCEKAAVLEREAIVQTPDLSPPYANLAQYYLALDRVDEARSTLREAAGRNLDDLSLRIDAYQLSFVDNDVPALETMVAKASGKPGIEDALLATHSDTAAFVGQLRKSRDLSRQAVESARANGSKETAASYLANHAVWEAEFGNASTAISDARSALALASGKDVQVAATLAFARAGDLSTAETLSRRLQKSYPQDTLLQLVWLPSIHAEVALGRHDAPQAIEFLRSAIPYELGAQTPFQCMYPVFIRGQALLKAHQSEAAAAEFRRIIDHRGLVANCPLGALAHLGSARSLAQMGNSPDSRTAYQNFLALFKDADTDVPLLQQAKREYENLQ